MCSEATTIEESCSSALEHSVSGIGTTFRLYKLGKSDGHTRIASLRLSFHDGHFRQQVPWYSPLFSTCLSPLLFPLFVCRVGTCLRACRKQDWRSPFAVARNKKRESIDAPSPNSISPSLSFLSLSPSIVISSR